MKKLTSKDFAIPTEEERAEQEKLTPEQQTEKDGLEQKAKEHTEEMKALCMEFFNDKIMGSNVPVSLIEDYFVSYFKASVAIYKVKSKEWKEHCEAKEKFELCPFKDLTIEEDEQN